MKHKFRKKLLNGDLSVGTMVTLKSPEVSEILSQVGFDWLFIDAEHAPFSTRDMQSILQSVGETPCLIRLASDSEVEIKKALDIGAAGIIVPQVNTAEQAEQVVRMARYYPEGNRGVGIGRAHGYGLKFQDYINKANDEITVVVQAEHIEAVNNIHSISEVPGIDAVLVGPYDLSASMGKLGKIENPDVVSAIDKVTKVCLDAGIQLGIFGVSAEAVIPYIEKGYTLIVAGVDTLMLAKSAQALLKNLKNK
jgi:2-dehydro-3-deoxyglucarate aldolase